MEFLEAYGSGWLATVASFALLIYTMHIHRVLNRLKKWGVTVIADLTDKSASFGCHVSASQEISEAVKPYGSVSKSPKLSRWCRATNLSSNQIANCAYAGQAMV